jgi:hypothetical protein
MFFSRLLKCAALSTLLFPLVHAAAVPIIPVSIRDVQMTDMTIKLSPDGYQYGINSTNSVDTAVNGKTMGFVAPTTPNPAAVVKRELEGRTDYSGQNSCGDSTFVNRTTLGSPVSFLWSFFWTPKMPRAYLRSFSVTLVR